VSSRRSPFRVTIALLLFSALLTVAGCGGQASDKTPLASGSTAKPDSQPKSRTVKHELGETPITGSPQKIVVLEFSFVDALASLGISPIGIADDGKKENLVPQIRSQVKDWTSVGTRKQPNLEVISSLQPDLIIADLLRHKDIYEKLSKIAPTIVLKSLEASYQENIDSLTPIALAVDKADAMKQIIDAHHKKLQTLGAKVPQNEGRKVLAAVVTNNLFNAHTAAAYTPGVLKQVGLSSAIDSKEAYAKLTLEQLVQINPDVIFLMASSGKLITDDWAANPLWQNLKAVKAGQVHKVDRDLWSKARGTIAATLIAEQALGALYGK
jgi:ABC-type Fe3+-citrate transport system substrate-binding protein